VRALPLAAGINEGGHYFRYFSSSSFLFLPPLFKTTEGVVVAFHIFAWAPMGPFLVFSPKTLKVTLQTCALKNLRYCRWGAEQRVSRAQTWERGPLSALAEISLLAGRITHLEVLSCPNVQRKKQM
jgi:hypothetical protein